MAIVERSGQSSRKGSDVWLAWCVRGRPSKGSDDSSFNYIAFIQRPFGQRMRTLAYGWAGAHRIERIPYVRDSLERTAQLGAVGELTGMTDGKLLQHSKTLKATKIYDAVIIGMLIGMAIYGSAKNGLGLLTFLPLFYLPIAKKYADKRQQAEQLVKERKLDH